MSSRVCVLDCTLRDGGYCNNWKFGYENKRKVISSLIEANVDIVECGILCKGFFSEDMSKYSNVDSVIGTIPKTEKKSLYVLLMNYGDYDVDDLPEHRLDGIDGIRFAFHKEDIEQAVSAIKKIKEKNYKVFMQPMVTVSYTTDEYVKLLEIANEIEPYAFYIVDSFGSMKSEQLRKYCYLANYVLKDEISLGFHSHNNLQLAYSNAQLFVNEQMQRNCIVDCCIMGMGRGAGNLNTELFLSYMNGILGGNYRVEPILSVIDEIINVFYQEKYWGYSLPNYLSATYNMHPNYASYLADKNTLTISKLGEVLSLVDIEKKNNFDKEYIEDLYVSFMSAHEKRGKVRTEFSDIFGDKEVLLIAPGKSIDTELDKIKTFLKKNTVISIGINFDFSMINTDYVFVSNTKRYDELDKIHNTKLIVTSNIDTKANCLIADYLSLLCDEPYIRDNAAMMLVNLLINSGTRKIYMAGLDGYSPELSSNYSRYSAVFVTSKEYMSCMNQGMNAMLQKYLAKIDIQFITSEKMIRGKK